MLIERRKGIYVMILAIMISLVFPFVRHHHHAGVICMESDINYETICNDKAHNHNSKQSSELPGTCIEKSDYIVERQVELSSFNDSLQTLLYLPIKILQISDLLSGENDLFSFIYKDENIKNTCFIQVHTLRAPPFNC
jgi:hypothetical protein